MRVRVLAVALFSVLMAMGQTATPQRKAVARPAAGNRTGSEDQRLEKAIRARFADSGIATDKFQVHVQGGVATIEGRTDVLQHKGVATRLAKSMGAVAVVNRVEISEAARERAAANLEKGRRRAQLRRSESRSESR